MEDNEEHKFHYNKKNEENDRNSRPEGWETAPPSRPE